MRAVKFFVPAIALIISLIAAADYRYYQRVNQEYSVDREMFVAAVSNALSKNLNREMYGEIERLEVHAADAADELRLQFTWLNSEFLRQWDSKDGEPRTEFVIDTKVLWESDTLSLFVWPCVVSVERQPLASVATERLSQVKFLLDRLFDLSPRIPLSPDAQWPPKVSKRMLAITRIHVNQDALLFSTGIPRISGQAYVKPEGWENAFDGICRSTQ